MQFYAILHRSFEVLLNLKLDSPLDYQDMSPDLFESHYAHSDRPLLVRKASQNWQALEAFDFEFFRNLYEDLESPVLENVQEGCQFFAWNFQEFHALQVRIQVCTQFLRILDI